MSTAATPAPPEGGPSGPAAPHERADHGFPERDATGRELPDRKTDEVRRMLNAPHPPVPAGLTARAAAQGRRLLRRRRLLRTALWLLAAAAAAAALVFLAVHGPAGQPPPVSPPRSW